MNTLIKTHNSSITENEIIILDGEVTIPLDYLRSRCTLESTSTLIASGSLIEGIGTIHSDIDCIVLCEARPKANDVTASNHALVTDINYHYLRQNSEVHNTTDFYGTSGLHIDIDYITYTEVHEIIKKIHTSYNEVTKDQRFLYSPVLLERENNVIHRTLTGHPLFNTPLYSELRSRIPKDKHTYLSHREKLPVFYAFQDIQGCWQSGNLWMGCEIARDLMFKSTMSLTFLSGMTNKHPKWIYSNMHMLSGHEELKNSFFELSRRGARSESECRKYIEETLNYIDRVFKALEKILGTSTSLPSQKESLAALDEEFNNRKHTEHKVSTCEYYFRKKYFAAEDTPSLVSLLKEWD